MKKIYNWKRFWCPRSPNINMIDSGYLPDPDSEYSRYFNPDLVTFDALTDIPCLILLGEPGIGKTTAMEFERDQIEKKIKESGAKALWRDLRAYQTDEFLVKRIFEDSDFLDWKKGKYRLHLFLDSLDECLLRISSVAALLKEEFKKYPSERMNLRIACRTADWPDSFEENLSNIWGKDFVKVYELAPLRRVDVIEAAKENNLDNDKFLKEIDNKEVVPLAIKPVTLKFLLNTFKKNGNFPSTQTELYYEGCRLLCEETSDSRRDAKLTGDLTNAQRIAIAARIAAITIFCNKYAIWTNIDRGDVPEADVTIGEILYDGRESVNDNRFDVNESTIKEVLSTGLFSSRGPNRMGWAHQTYAEFLAADYLVQHKLETKEAMKLITHPDDPEGKLVPQLHETAAWMACMELDIFREIIIRDPEVLLHSDVATVDVKDKEALFENLLELYDNNASFDSFYDRQFYKKFNFPGLENKLKKYIVDKNKNSFVRVVAINFAEECKLKGLQDDLLRLVLDTSENSPIRAQAAHAIYMMGDIEVKLKLKSLAIKEDTNDPEDELKGYALLSLWPDYITAEELFLNITTPKGPNVVGAYDRFISENLAEGLKPEDIPIALEWINDQGPKDYSDIPFVKLMDHIILKAWEYLEFDDIIKHFANTVLDRLNKDDTIIGDFNQNEYWDIFNKNDNKRHMLLDYLFNIVKNSHDIIKDFIIVGPTLIEKDDLSFMINKLLSSSDTDMQKAWAFSIRELIRYFPIDTFSFAQINSIISASKQNSILEELLRPFLEPTCLSSQEAKSMKKAYSKYLEIQREINNRHPLEPPPSQRILLLLDEFESGDILAWQRLNIEMTLEPSNDYYGNELEADLTALPGWKEADDTIKARIISAAKRYILKHETNMLELLGKNKSQNPDFAGYRAFRLLLKEDTSFYETLSADVWEKWAPVILTSQVSNGENHDNLVKLFYKNAPEEIIKTLNIIIEQEAAKRYSYFFKNINICWDEFIEDSMVAHLKNMKIKPKAMGTILRHLLSHNVIDAKNFAKSLCVLPIPKIAEDRNKLIECVLKLMLYTEDGAWDTIWPVLNKDKSFAKEIILIMAKDAIRYKPNIFKKLKEDELAELFIWLEHQYPKFEQTILEGGEYYDYLSDFSGKLLNNLKTRGNFQAVNAIRRIMNELPDMDSLKKSFWEAKNIARKSTWEPQKPRGILELIKDRNFRLVQNEEHLLDVLIESLKRFEVELQGETPAAPDLWNEIEKGKFRPKDENAFSNRVKRHLENDLKGKDIIVNREVEIRRGTGSGKGEITDIHVDAIARNPIDEESFDKISAIIEVKGCWNKDLKTAMKSQLLDRYLKDNPCNHGLYLVGWFMCDQWDENDHRKRKRPKITIEEAQKQFDEQAAGLSNEGKMIRALVINASLR